jgi:S1-C subfamily serine protease
MKILFRSFFFVLFAFLLQTQIMFAQQPETKVTLGIKPDYMYTFKGKGVRVTDVLDGQTAKQAGIKAGDIITAFNGDNIKDIFEYKDQLSKFTSGEKVKVTINRDGQVFTIPVQFK